MKNSSIYRSNLMIALLAGLTLSWTVETSHSTELRIGFFVAGSQSIPTWIADAKGFYKEYKIEPIYIPVASGPMMSSGLAGDSIDIGHNAPSNVGIAREQGLDQVIVSGNMLMPLVLIARTDVKLPHAGQYPQVIADLKGLNWGSFGRGADTENFLRVMAKAAGLDVDKDMTWIGVGPPATGLAALKSGRVDIYMTNPPAPEIATAGGYGKIVLDFRRGEGPADFKGAVYSIITALRKSVERQPQLYENLIKAHNKAICWVKDPKNFEELVELLRPKLFVNDFSEDQYRDLIKSSIALLTIKYPTTDLTAWSNMMVPAGFIKNPIPTDTVWKNSPQSELPCS